MAAFASAIGNHAMCAFVARSPLNDGASGAGPTGSPEDRGFQLERATDAEKLAEIEVRLSENQSSVAEVWRSFGDMVATANANGDLWKRSVAKEPDLAEDEAVAADFKQRVEAIAVMHLEENRKLVVAELEALGITPNVNGRGGTVDESPEHVKEVEKLQRLAADVAKAMKAKEALLQIPVGWDSEQGRYVVQVGQIPPNQVVFQPGKPPPVGPKPKDKHMRPYAEVAEHYKVVEATLARGMAHPALFSLMSYDGGLLGAGIDPARLVADFSTASRRGASVAITNNMRILIEKIETAARGIGSEIDHRDLVPVHEQVMKAAPFSEPYAQSVARKEVAGHETMKTLINIGLTAVQVVSLVAASLATGGAAALLPLVGAAAGGVQAGISIDEYGKLKTARDARTGSREHDLVGQEQVDEAQIAAVLDTVFAFLDGVEAVSGLAKAARGGAKAAEELAPSLSKLKTLDPAQKETVLLEAMESMGTGKAIEAAGGIEAVRGAGAGAAGARAEAFAAEMEQRVAEHLAGRAEAAAGEIVAERATYAAEAERYVAQISGVSEGKALDTLAPGLKSEERLEEMVAKFKARPAAAWANLSPVERRALVHDGQAAKYAHVGMPVPKAQFDKGLSKGQAHFNANTWTITYAEADFTGEITQGQVMQLTVNASHEFRHAEQEFAVIRYELAKGLPPEGNPEAIAKAMEVHGARPMDLASDEARQAEEWFHELHGAGRGATKDAQRQLKLLAMAKKQAKDALAAAQDKAAALAKLRAGGQATAEELEAAAEEACAAHRKWKEIEAREAMWAPLDEATIKRYKGLKHEADAYARGDEVMAELDAELRRCLTAEFDKVYSEQAAQMKSSMDALVAAGVLGVAAAGAAGATYYAIKTREPAGAK